ncbi:MAG TPA: hypothetical protein VNQ56_17145 [Pseudolabrys sp.]|nr:hypothetical protein [Pseudolabrys sp.]
MLIEFYVSEENNNISTNKYFDATLYQNNAKEKARNYPAGRRQGPGGRFHQGSLAGPGSGKPGLGFWA